MAEEKGYLYGPVPSRRLGLSLGVDIVPFKVCTLDCIYCQLGLTTNKTTQRKEYVPVEAVLVELREILARGLKADFITIGGSGEPTLNSRLGDLIDGIKKNTDIPVAILTNGTLLYREDVRRDCAKADVVLPSLDAGDERTFRKINRPCKDISIERLVEGLAAFRSEFSGQIWLEVLLIEDLNTENKQISNMKRLIERICPDKIQLNMAVRPTAEADVRKLDAEKLKSVAARLGDNCEIVAGFSQENDAEQLESRPESVLSMLKRRPCTLEDICSSLGVNLNEAMKYISHLQDRGLVHSMEKDSVIFYKAH